MTVLEFLLLLRSASRKELFFNHRWALDDLGSSRQVLH